MRTRSKRNSNKKTIASAGLLALAAISVFSVGFASWIIGSETTKSTDQFTVNVEDVTDSRVQITSAAMTDSSIKFGSVTDNEGLITSTTNDEDLTLAFQIKVSALEIGNFQGFQFYFADKNDAEYEGTTMSAYLASNSNKVFWPGQYGTDDTAYINLVDKDWKTEGTYYAIYSASNIAPSVGSEDNHNWSVDVTTSETEVTFTITLDIKWGSFFSGANPVKEQYPEDGDFAGKDVQQKATLFKEALTGLKAINGAKSVINVKHPTEAIQIA